MLVHYKIDIWIEQEILSTSINFFSSYSSRTAKLLFQKRLRIVVHKKNLILYFRGKILVALRLLTQTGVILICISNFHLFEIKF